ncbi:Uncharacterised protein [Mycobacteroides abscessus subsp. abscessus]|nr:Uncharacterised protein [Mycobacteroides abscessus subsp. abscessus]
MRVHRERRQHLRQPRLDIRILSVDTAHRAIVDIGIVGEHFVQIIELAGVDGGGIVDQELLNLQAVGNFVESPSGCHSL